MTTGSYGSEGRSDFFGVNTGFSGFRMDPFQDKQAGHTSRSESAIEFSYREHVDECLPRFVLEKKKKTQRVKTRVHGFTVTHPCTVVHPCMYRRQQHITGRDGPCSRASSTGHCTAHVSTGWGDTYTKYIAVNNKPYISCRSIHRMNHGNYHAGGSPHLDVKPTKLYPSRQKRRQTIFSSREDVKGRPTPSVLPDLSDTKKQSEPSQNLKMDGKTLQYP